MAIKRIFLINLFFIIAFDVFSMNLKITFCRNCESRLSEKIKTDLFFIIDSKKTENTLKFPYKYELFNDPAGLINYSLFSKIKADYYSNKNMHVPYINQKDYKFEQDAVVIKIFLDNKPLYIILYGTTYRDDYAEEHDKKIAEVKAVLDIIADIYSKETNPYIMLICDLNSPRLSEPLNILQKSGLVILNYFYNQNALHDSANNKNTESVFFIMNDYLYKNCRINSLKSIKFKRVKNYPLVLDIKIN